MVVLLIRLSTWLTQVLPLPAQLWLADALAAAGWRLLPAMHSRVRENVRNILGPDAAAAGVERIARQQWRNYLRYLRDFAALPHSAPADMEGIFAAVHGWEHIQQAMGEGHGLVLVSAHFGNWDLAAGTLAQRYPVNIIADTFASSRLDAAINARRDALGIQVIPIDKALKRTISALRRNEVVAFLVDKPVPGDAGVEVEFFGRSTRIPAGAAYFAARVGAPLIPAFVWRTEDGGFAARVSSPIKVDGDARATMQRVMHVVEEQIRRYPDHWYMFRRMWGAEPRSEPVHLEEAVA